MYLGKKKNFYKFWTGSVCLDRTLATSEGTSSQCWASAKQIYNEICISNIFGGKSLKKVDLSTALDMWEC